MVESLRDSIQYAFDHEDDALDYAMQFSRGTERETVRRFIRMYVNDDTLDMGDEGEKALETLFGKGAGQGHHRLDAAHRPDLARAAAAGNGALPQPIRCSHVRPAMASRSSPADSNR